MSSRAPPQSGRTSAASSASGSYSLPSKSPLTSALRRSNAGSKQPPPPHLPRVPRQQDGVTASDRSLPSSSASPLFFAARDDGSEHGSSSTNSSSLLDDDDDTPSPSLSSLAHPAGDVDHLDLQQQSSASSSSLYTGGSETRRRLQVSSSSSSLSSSSSESAFPASASFIPFSSTFPPASSSSSPRGKRPRPVKESKPQPPLQLPPVQERLQRFTLYETRQRYYLVGSELSGSVHRLLKLDRSDCSLSVSEDATAYSSSELASLLDMVKTGNAQSGGILSVTRCAAVIGFVRFLLGFYVYVVTGSREVGRIGCHSVQQVVETQLLPLTHQSVYDSGLQQAQWKRHKTSESRYRSLFLSLDTSRCFYFSHTYDLTNTLQLNMIAGGQQQQQADAGAAAAREQPQQPVEREKSMYVWNHCMRLKPQAALSSVSSSSDDPLLLPLSRSDWCVSLVHGYFEQSTLSVLGRALTLTLLSRRSRFYAGTRYLKRGVNSSGHAANDVETEQILHDRAAGDAREGAFTAYVSMRASIPVHWTQEPNPIIAQPAIVMQRLDPLHLSTRLHVQDVWRRYGSPLLILNLVKQSEQRKRESIIGAAWGEAVEFLNQFIAPPHCLDFLAWDFKRVSKSKTLHVMDELTVIAHWAMQRTGLFHSRPKQDAVLVHAADTRDVKPTRESLRDWGLQGLPQRRAQEKRSRKGQAAAAAGEEEKEGEREGDTARSGRDDDRREGRSARSAGSGGEYSATDTPLSAPFLLSSIREERLSARDSGDPSSARSARPGRASFDEVNGVSLSSLSLSPSSSFSSSSFSSSAPSPQPRQPRNIAFLQRGVCRANCVDSLDRTNAAAYCLGKCALGYQLHALSLLPSPVADSVGPIGSVLLDMYERMGDAIALQYGGSQMHRQVKKEQQTAAAASAAAAAARTAPVLFASLKQRTSKPAELLTSLVRHYANSFQDTSKQDAMNLWLGLFRPHEQQDGLQLWDMQSDYYLHNPPPAQSDDEQKMTAEEKAALLVQYDDESWWQQPILDNERLQGPFALSPAQLFSSAPQSSRLSPSTSFSASSPIAPSTLVTAAAECDLRAVSAPALPSLQLSVGQFLRPRARSASQSPSSQLSFMSAYGPLQALTEFDSLLQADALSAPRAIAILGLDKTESSRRDEEKKLQQLASDVKEAADTGSSPVQHKQKRSKRARGQENSEAEAALQQPQPELHPWELEQCAARDQQEERRKAAVYSLDSSYAFCRPAPSIPPPVQSLYFSHLNRSVSELLVPDSSVRESEAIIAAARRDKEQAREQQRRAEREQREVEREQRRHRDDAAGRRGSRHRTLPAAAPSLPSSLARQSIGSAGLAVAARKVSIAEDDSEPPVRGRPRLSSFVVSVAPLLDSPESLQRTAPSGLLSLAPRQSAQQEQTATETEANSEAASSSPSSSPLSSPAGLSAMESALPLPIVSAHQLALFRLYFAYHSQSQLNAELWRSCFQSHRQYAAPHLPCCRSDDALYREAESDVYYKFLSLR